MHVCIFAADNHKSSSHDVSNIVRYVNEEEWKQLAVRLQQTQENEQYFNYGTFLTTLQAHLVHVMRNAEASN
jgi:hypothetical protein